MATLSRVPAIRAGMMSFAVACTLAAASSARADWTVCNRTANDLWVAIAFDSSGSYTSQGWWKLGSCGGCAKVHSGEFSTTGAFLFAEDKNAAPELKGNNFLFCVANERFNFTAENKVRGQCANERHRMVDFSLHQVRGNHTTNINRNPSSSGPICID
jgi:uncharacterized membrane protein